MKFHVYRAADGWRWRLVAENGRIIADSAEAYLERRDAEHGIQLIRDGAPTALVEIATTDDRP